MRIDIEATGLSVVTGAAGVIAALTLAAPPALADPATPTPAPPPPPALALADPTIPTSGPPPPPAQDGTVQAAGDPALPPEGVPHLSSPENLPPGTSSTPVDAGQPRTLGYLRDLWHAVRTQEVTGRDAVLLLTQRPLDPNAVPPPGMSPGPQPLPPPEPAPTP